MKSISVHNGMMTKKDGTSLFDVVAVLTESENPNNYWKVLKNRLKKEGSELVTDCNQLKMQSSDGKMGRLGCKERARVCNINR